MSEIEEVRQRLMKYFACVAYAGRVYGPREFNANVMMNTYDPDGRAVLGVVLEEMVGSGILRRFTPLEYTLTPAGLQMAQQARSRSGSASGLVERAFVDPLV